MLYRVEISPSALADAEESFRWIYGKSPSDAATWFSNLLKTIDTLEEFPRRCSLAPESEELGKEIRQLLFMMHHSTYRILFEIAGDEVRIYRIRHGSRNRIQAADLRE